MWNSFCNLKYMKNLVLVFVPFFLLSCSSNIKKELGQVNELVFELTALEDSFLSVERNKVDEAVKDYKYNMSRIKKYYHLDTVDRDFVQLMNSYKTIKKGGKGLDKDALNIQSNITTMKQQLSNLKADLENQLLAQDSIQFYLSNEELNLNFLNEDISNYVLTCDAILSLDDSLSNKVKALINSYSE